MKVRINSLSGIYPSYETEGSAGMDIRAYLEQPVIIKPGERKMIPTGLFMEFEPGYEVQIRARSGLAAKHGIGLVNGVGTIDSDYRGEIIVALINLGQMLLQSKMETGSHRWSFHRSCRQRLSRQMSCPTQ